MLLKSLLAKKTHFASEFHKTFKGKKKPYQTFQKIQEEETSPNPFSETSRTLTQVQTLRENDIQTSVICKGTKILFFFF